MVVGALAVAIWGKPRATTDVDLMIQVPPGAWERVKRRAGQAGFEFDAVWDFHNPMLRDQHARFFKNKLAVDFMGVRDAQDQQAVQRRRFKMFVPGRRISVIAPDDLVLHKIKAGRPRDFDDAVGVLRRSGALMDYDYLWNWATRFRMDDELAYLLRHISENP